MTSGVVVGSSPAGIGWKPDVELGTEMGCVVSRLLPGGSTCTSDLIIGVLVTAGAGGGAPGASAASAVSREEAWLDAKLVSTFCTCARAAGLEARADDATESSAEAIVCPTAPVASIFEFAILPRMSSAADWLAADSTTPGAAVTTASTSDAAAVAAAGESAVPFVPDSRDPSICDCNAPTFAADRLANEALKADAFTDVRFNAGGCSTTGAATMTLVHGVSPRLFKPELSDATSDVESDATAVTPDATDVASAADVSVTENATAAPEASRRRRATSVTPVMSTTVGSTFSVVAITLTNTVWCCAVKVATDSPANVAEDRTLYTGTNEATGGGLGGGDGGGGRGGDGEGGGKGGGSGGGLGGGGE